MDANSRNLLSLDEQSTFDALLASFHPVEVSQTQQGVYTSQGPGQVEYAQASAGGNAASIHHQHYQNSQIQGVVASSGHHVHMNSPHPGGPMGAVAMYNDAGMGMVHNVQQHQQQQHQHQQSQQHTTVGGTQPAQKRKRGRPPRATPQSIPGDTAFSFRVRNKASKRSRASGASTPATDVDSAIGRADEISKSDESEGSRRSSTVKSEVGSTTTRRRKNTSLTAEERKKKHTLSEKRRRDLTKKLLKNLSVSIPAVSVRDVAIKSSVEYHSVSEDISGLPLSVIKQCPERYWKLLNIATLKVKWTKTQEEKTLIVHRSVARTLLQDAQNSAQDYQESGLEISCGDSCDEQWVMDDEDMDLLMAIGFDGKIQKNTSFDGLEDCIFPKAVLLARAVGYIRQLEGEITALSSL